MNNDPFAKLGALDQKLYQKPSELAPTMPQKEPVTTTPKPQSLNASNTANRQAINTAGRHDGKAAGQQASKPSEKVTYRFHPQGVKAINEIKWLLLNDHEIKADLAEIAEEAIFIVHKDLMARRQASNIVLQLKSKTASRKKG